jgi:hypothetical protein
MGNPDVKSRHTQRPGGSRSRDMRYRRRLCSTIGVANANGLTEGSNLTGCHGGILSLIKGFWSICNALI